MTNASTCFVIMPIRRHGSEEYVQYRALYDTVIRPPLLERGYEVTRADDVTKAGAINADVIRRLATADLVVADLTELNANVFYELGIRHSLRRYGTILVVNLENTTVPFDLQAYRIIEYTPDLLGYEKLREALLKFSIALESGGEPPTSDSPVHDVLPSLPIDVFAFSEGSTEGDLRAQISELQAQVRRYGEKFGTELASNIDGVSDIISRTLDQAVRGELPRDLFRKAREAARDENAVEFLTNVNQLINSSTAGTIAAENWLQLSIDAINLNLSEVASGMNLRAMQQRPNDENLKSAYYVRLAHSEDPRERERGRTELRTVLGVEFIDGKAIIRNKKQQVTVAAIMLDAYHSDGLHEDAYRIASALLELHPSSTVALRNVARALAELDRIREAAHYYQRAVAAPDVDDTSASWFASFLSTRDLNEASCVYYCRACELDPEDAINFARVASVIGDILFARLSVRSSNDDIGTILDSSTVIDLLMCAFSCRQLPLEVVDIVRNTAAGLDFGDRVFEDLLSMRRGDNEDLRPKNRSERISYVANLREVLHNSAIVSEQLKSISTNGDTLIET